MEPASRVRPSKGLLRSAERSCESHSKTFGGETSRGTIQMDNFSYKKPVGTAKQWSFDWRCLSYQLVWNLMLISSIVSTTRMWLKWKGKTWRLQSFIMDIYICMYMKIYRICKYTYDTRTLKKTHTHTHHYGVPHVRNTIGKEDKTTYPFSILYDTLHHSGMPKSSFWRIFFVGKIVDGWRWRTPKRWEQ